MKTQLFSLLVAEAKCRVTPLEAELKAALAKLSPAQLLELKKLTRARMAELGHEVSERHALDMAIMRVCTRARYSSLAQRVSGEDLRVTNTREVTAIAEAKKTEQLQQLSDATKLIKK